MNDEDTRALIAETLTYCETSDPASAAALVFTELSTRGLVADARLIRWCDWPDCLESFHRITGPDPEIDGRGWINTATHDLLCPRHANTGHRPLRPSWERQAETMTAYCECGASADDVKATLNSNNEWWREHVRTAVRAGTEETR